MYRIKVDKNDKASLTPAVVMYSKLKICARAHVEMVSRLDINLPRLGILPYSLSSKCSKMAIFAALN